MNCPIRGKCLPHTRVQESTDGSEGLSKHSDHLLGKTQGSDKQQPFSPVVGPHYYIFDKGNERLSLTLHDSPHNDTEPRQNKEQDSVKEAPTPHLTPGLADTIMANGGWRPGG